MRESSPQCLPQLFRSQSFIKIVAAVFRLASNTFPAVAIERCGWGWSSFWGRAYSHTEWVFGDCLSRKPYPPCDVTGVKFQCEEGGREGAVGPYLFQLWPMRNNFFCAPACRGGKKGRKKTFGVRVHFLDSCSLKTLLISTLLFAIHGATFVTWTHRKTGYKESLETYLKLKFMKFISKSNRG